MPNVSGLFYFKINILNRKLHISLHRQCGIFKKKINGSVLIAQMAIFSAKLSNIFDHTLSWALDPILLCVCVCVCPSIHRSRIITLAP